MLAVFSGEHCGQSRTAEAQAQLQLPQIPPVDGGYVGSKACAECHRAIYSVYLQTDMGRSMSVVSSALLAKVPNSSQIFDAELNRHFEVSVKGGGLYQHDYESQPDGAEVFRDTQKIEWIIGAGATGFGGIVRRGDALFEAPLSYYSETQSWALSPGYQSYDFGFSRPIDPQCISCHSGRPRPIRDGNGRFLDPPFAELAVGCENCHGPGATHVSQIRDHRPGKEDHDLSIVNPAKLPSWLADNICMSCHQTGDARVLQPGKTFQDFRPGTPLNDTVAILMVPPKHNDPPRSDLLQHYFSMTLSKCYLRSQNRLRCITCHDPHFQPDSQLATFYFRSKCLSCHTEKSCAVPLVARQRKNPPNDCAGCHMPRSDLKEISHAALTNHRILRESGEPYPVAAFHMTTPEVPDLVHVNPIPKQKHIAISEVTLLQAYGQLIEAHPEYRERYLTLAAQLQGSDPDDISVLEALAYGALAKQKGGDAAEAVDYLTRAIRRGSTRPADFEQCAGLLIRTGRLAEAIDMLERGIKAIPHDGELYRLLGFCYLSQNKPLEAAQLLMRATGMFPENTAIRLLLFRARKAISEK